MPYFSRTSAELRQPTCAGAARSFRAISLIISIAPVLMSPTTLITGQNTSDAVGWRPAVSKKCVGCLKATLAEARVCAPAATQADAPSRSRKRWAENGAMDLELYLAMGQLCTAMADVLWGYNDLLII
mmetsp:Transcript_60646/g.144475  ORF Transcript_60646/g.144475 Transcript_60646/m.144475 type:complete len:128 (+) Transcript_60646:840-1223(+)